MEDTCLVKILAFSGPHKLADKFEQSTFEIVDHSNKDIPVYVVRDDTG